MNKPKPITKTVRAAALVGAFSLIAVATTQATFTALPSPTPEFPGVTPLLDAGGGTVVDFKSSSFTNAFNTGTLNTWVVDADGAGPGTSLDFYYQVVNTGAVPPPGPGDDIFRFKTTGGFKGLTLSVAQSLAAPGPGGAVPTGKLASSADRDEGSPGSVGFDFGAPPAFVGDPNNLQPGEAGSFLIVRTNSSSYHIGNAAVSSGDTGFVSTFVAVPEPTSLLFGLAMFGVTLNSRIKSRRTKTA
jgi:hypothetical protein